MPKWLKKVKVYSPRQVKAKDCRELAGYMVGGVVYVVAPGPSLDEFPKDRLDDFPTIAVNSAAELIQPTWWLFQEGFFLKRYHPIYTSKWIRGIVTTKSRADILEKVLPAGKTVHVYQSQYEPVLGKKRSGKTKRHPWLTHEATPCFLPGRNSVAANALSLAVLMEASLIVCVGIDLNYEEDKYYAKGVQHNPGPRDRQRALSASKAWMAKAARYGVWRGPQILTTSTTLKLRCFQRVTPDEAIRRSEEVLKSSNGHL